MKLDSRHHRNPAHASPAPDGPTRNRTPEESGMRIEQHTTQTSTALLRNANSVDASETNSLCCEAAGIIASSSSTTESLTHHEKLREAAAPDATLIAQNRPPAQPVEGYMHHGDNREIPSKVAVNEVQIDERAELEKEFLIPEGAQYCVQRDTHITAPSAKISDSRACEHYACRASFTAWKRRAWKHAALVAQQAKGEASQ